jgi:REP element-mobilizing transposase RayT
MIQRANFNNKLPERKPLRYRNFDYTSYGCYFITICSIDMKNIFSEIIKTEVKNDVNITTIDKKWDIVNGTAFEISNNLTTVGIVVKKYIEGINNHFLNYKLENYIIMPNHVHLLISNHQPVWDDAWNDDHMVTNVGDDDHIVPPNDHIIPPNDHIITNVGDDDHIVPKPNKTSIPKIIKTLKTLTTKELGISIWQRSYHDRIVRNEEEYWKLWQYINDNPQRWLEDRYHKQ